MNNIVREGSPYQDDIYAVETSGIKLDAYAKDYAKCSMAIDRRHYNSDGNVMGGAIFTLADYAFGVASNVENPPTVSLTGTIEFLRATQGPVLYAEAKAIKSGRRIGFYEVTVTDSSGKTVAAVLLNGFREAE